tara:strand:- start:108 stop:368 length:261 start_codon:yes stop_codon:yes gene_type:complete
MKGLTFINILLYLILINLSYAEINKAQKKIIKNQIILIHEGMVSEEEVFKKAKLFDNEGIFGIGKTEMSEKEFKSFLKKESLHFGY